MRRVLVGMLTVRRRVLVAGLAAVAAACVVPAAASAHAYLINTVPAASGILNGPPRSVALTYDEAVEPRFAIISVTSATGTQETAGPVRRSPANPDTLLVALRPMLGEGWYLIYWRAISVDGHPVQGFYTYAVGPNAGPAPQFSVPSISATAVTPQLLIARWVMFIAVMVSIGLLTMRLVIARPIPGRGRGDQSSLHAVSVAFVIASGLGLIAIPVYLDFATANDSLRSVSDLASLVPLYRVTAFGRAYVDLELCFCAVLRCGVDLAVGRSPRAGAPVGGGDRRGDRRADRRCGGADDSRCGWSRRANRPPAASHSRWTGCIWSPARCGSGVSSACSCCGSASAPIAALAR
ncbi:MAG: copper resistance CopC family protein [Solirubrobacteraceae bacterium]